MASIFQVRNITRGSLLASRVHAAGESRERRKGLLSRDGLSCGEGLWIAPCEAIHTFTMRFPIDAIFLDRKNRVRKITAHLRPWRMSVCLTAHSVLELAAGAAASIGMQVADRLVFEPAENSR